MTQSTTATCTASDRGESSSILGKMRLPSILNAVHWPYARGAGQDSVGRFLGTVSLHRILSVIPVRLDCWEATGPARRVFANRLGLEIAEYLDCNSDLCESGSIFHMSLYMVGASPSRAKPTLMFVSGDAKVRKDAFKMIKQSKILESYPGFALAHIPLEAEYENFRQLAGIKEEARIDLTPASTQQTISVLTTKDGGNTGRRLYFSDETDGKPKDRTATAGGIVSFQGRPMFFTVCHAASETCASDKQIQVEEDELGAIAGFSDLDLGSQESSDDTLAAITSRASESPQSSPSSADETSSIFSSGVVSEQTSWETPHESLPRDIRNIDNQMLLAGDIVLSSSEWDCLLVDVHWTLLPHAKLELNRDVEQRPWIPLEGYSSMVEPEARDARVTATTPDRGIIGGMLSGTPSFVRLPFSKKFQQVYTAKFDKPLAPGDCGCWVRDATTGKLFGHVIAGSPTTGLATIIPSCRVFPFLLSELSGKEPDKALAASRTSHETLSRNSAATVARPMGPDSKKRQASGVLQGFWSSLKKTKESKDNTADSAKNGNSAHMGNTTIHIDSVAKSASVATTTLVPQDDNRIEKKPKVAQDETESTLLPPYPEPLSSHFSQPYEPYVFQESPFSTRHIIMGSASPFLHEKSWSSPSLYGEDSTTISPSLSATTASSSKTSTPAFYGTHIAPIPEWAVPPEVVELVDFPTCSIEYSFTTGFEFNPKRLGFVEPSLIHPDARSTGMPGTHHEGDPLQGAVEDYRGFGPWVTPSFAYGPKETTLCSASSPTPNEEENPKQRCPHPDCGKVFKDLKAHMLTHQTERPEKCPIDTCEYHVKGFARKYDRNRHALTHYKGTMVCGFCPNAGSATEKSFNRADVFKRHLTAVHGVEQTPPNSRKRYDNSSASSKKTEHAPDAGGKCSICTQTFSNALDFYEHLDDCVLRIVQQEYEAAAINAKRLTEVENDTEVHNVLERNSLPASTKTLGNANHGGDKEEDEDQDEDMDDDDNPQSGKGLSPKFNHLKDGLSSGSRGRKIRRYYPSSWGFDKGKLSMKEQVMAVFNGPRRIEKDDVMLSTENKVRVSLPNGKSYVTDLDAETLKRAAAFVGATENGQERLWVANDPSGAQEKVLRDNGAAPDQQTAANHQEEGRDEERK